MRRLYLHPMARIHWRQRIIAAETPLSDPPGGGPSRYGVVTYIACLEVCREYKAPSSSPFHDMEYICSMSCLCDAISNKSRNYEEDILGESPVPYIRNSRC